MLRLFRFAAVPMALAMSAPLWAQAGDECRPASTALVLSGGGATGIAHVGVIRVLDSLGIRPDLIVGSSMGAVVGAMYASGYGGRALDSVVRAIPLHELFGGRPELPEDLATWPHQLAFRFGHGTVRPELPLVNERDLNILLSAWLLEGNLRAAGDFDSLPIPFRAVATDLGHRQRVVLDGGDLAWAVRASIAIPILFRPVRAGDRWLGDGSLSANLPVSVARELGVERIIVSDATNHLADTLDLERWGNMGTLMLSMLLTQETEPLGPEDILVRSDVSGFPKFDFSPEARATLIERGYAAGREALRDAACMSGPAVGRRELPSTPRPVTLAPTEGEGASLLQRYVRTDDGAAVDAPALRNALLTMGGDEAGYDELWLNPRAVGDVVRLSVSARPCDPWVSALGVAYDGDLGVRGWVGTVRRSLIRGRGTGHVRVGAGRWRQEGEGGMRFGRIGPMGAEPLLSVGAAHEQVRRFSEVGAALPAVETGDVWVAAGLARSLNHGWRARVTVTYAAWRDSTSRSDAAPGLAAEISRSSPANGPGGRVEVVWNARYARLSVHGVWPVSVGRLRVTPTARYGWGRGLPIQHEFTIGGTEGFPGLQMGAWRGPRELLVRLGLSYRVVGPVSVTAESAFGTTAAGGGVIPDGDWRFGVRGGLSVAVPFGPLRIEYGRSTGGRSALFLRLGTWF